MVSAKKFDHLPTLLTILGFLRIAEFATHWFCEASQGLLNHLEIYALWQVEQENQAIGRVRNIWVVSVEYSTHIFIHSFCLLLAPLKVISKERHFLFLDKAFKILMLLSKF